MHSPNLTEANIARLAELFPACVTEERTNKGDLVQVIDFDKLRQELSGKIIEGPRERYHLDWPGKREALLTANSPIAKTLRPLRQKSVDFDSTKNLVIEGDNLDALKLLQETFLNKVRVIYIDPPYNTGKEFIYDDDFADDAAEYLRRSGQADERGLRLVANTESNGRFHSDWLSMMYPRLRLARNLLAEDGVIVVSIDDHEVQNLRHLMDEVFGGANFVATVIWHKMDSPKNSAKHLSEDHEYIVMYAKNAEVWKPNLLPRSQEMLARYKNPDNDPRGPWLLGDLAARNPYSAGIYSIKTPSGKVIEGPPPGSYWRVSEPKFKELDQDRRIWWGTGDTRPGIKRFLSEVRDGVVPQTYWSWEDVGSTRNAKQELNRILGSETGDLVFDTPKPKKLLNRLLQICTSSNRSDIVLDFFAGSGTTGHAVIERNAEDGGNRRFILVQLPEPIESEKYRDIASLCEDRIRRSGASIVEEAALSRSKLDVGFRVLSVDTSNMKDVFYDADAVAQSTLTGLVDNVKEDRSDEDLVLQIMIEWGLDLTLPIKPETVNGKSVHFVDTDALAACFETGINEAFIKELAKRKPLRAVFRDTGYGSDATKINVEQIFKLLSPTTEVKSI
jgi:adenine-specific DNA-methyltransferase